MAYKRADRARMDTATTGTGTVTLGAAVGDVARGYYQDFAAAGVTDQDVVPYLITDGTGWEIGIGVYTEAGTTLTRVLESSSTGALLNLSGTADVAIVSRANEFFAQVATDISPPGSGTVHHLAGRDGEIVRLVGDSFGSTSQFVIQGRHARGTANAKTASQADDLLLNFGGLGYGATGYAASSRANIQFHAAENWTDAAQGGYIRFNVTPKTTIVPFEGMRLTSQGKLVIATAVPESADHAMLSVVRSGADEALQIASYQTGLPPSLRFRGSRGTEATPSATLNNDRTMAFVAGSFGVTTWANHAAINIYATQDQTESARGSQIEFATTPNGSTVRATALMITQDKKANAIGGFQVNGIDIDPRSSVSRTFAGTTDTLVLADWGKTIRSTGASAAALTIPPNSSVAIPVDGFVNWEQSGAGTITFTPGAGVTLRSRGSKLRSAGQYAAGSFHKIATDEWFVMGDTIV